MNYMEHDLRLACEKATEIFWSQYNDLSKGKPPVVITRMVVGCVVYAGIIFTPDFYETIRNLLGMFAFHPMKYGDRVELKTHSEIDYKNLDFAKVDESVEFEFDLIDREINQDEKGGGKDFEIDIDVQPPIPPARRIGRRSLPQIFQRRLVAA